MNPFARTRTAGTDGVDPRRPGGLRWDVYLALALLTAAVHATGLVGDVLLILLSVATPVAGILAVRTYRPLSAKPWVLLIVAGVVWSIAGAIRAWVGATGDLTADRNLLPDVLAIAGYTLFAVGLILMLRANGNASGSWALTVDGGIMALSVMLVFWVTLVAPVIFRLDAAPIAKLSIVMYPPISACLVWIAARLAFGASARGRSHQLLLAGMLALLIGDVAYVPLETHLLTRSPGNLLELPYAVAYAILGAAILHPSMRNAVRPNAVVARRQGARFALIAVALLTPSIMLLVWSPEATIERVVVAALAVVLEVAAISRVVVAARAQDAVEQRLAHRASHDELTGLLNRPAALEVIGEALDDARANGSRLGVLFIDLDRFKLVNDSYGHAVGDELLLAAADRLRTTVGDDDTVARLSGDEFLVIAPNTDVARARQLAARICEVFAQPFELIGTAWVSASIGVVVSETGQDPVSATSLIRDADAAMYEAKAAGRSGFALFHPSMRAASERHLEVYNGLHRAIEHDQFEAFYQVIIDRRSGTVHGVEALVRWRTSEGDLVPPDDFVSLAEDSGLISVIGEIVLRRACAQVARWRRLPGCADLTLSVNVSGRQFMDVDMVAVVSDALEDAGLDPDALWLEITESVMMTDSLDTLATMSGLRSLGVHLSVDDFGTGYSSLSYLQRFPIEQVKIDRRFVGGMCDHTEDEAVVAAVVGIAKALGMSVVAEGVEEQRQVDQLAQYDCDLLQGFLFSRPMPALDLGPVLLERNEVGLPPSFGR